MGSLWVQALGALPFRAPGTSSLACPLHPQYCTLAAPTLRLVSFCTNVDLRAQSGTVPLCMVGLFPWSIYISMSSL